MKKLKNVISLFDGMSCAQIALNQSKIEYENYFASEIDKYGQIVSKANFPNTKYIGDVRFVSYKDGILTTQFGTFNIGKVDLLCGGSPCQSFSFAGKRKGMATKDEQEILTLDRYLQLKAEEYEFEGQSYLFWEYMRILTEIQAENPDVKFLLENVIMGEKWQTILTRAIGIQPIEINAALVSAQNRRRLFWTNIGAEPDGLFGDIVCKIQQPKDKGILLKDILEQEVDEKYFLSEKTIESLNNWKDRNKMAGNGFEPVVKDEFEKSASLTTGSMKSNATYIKIDKQGNKKQNQDKASCFTAGGHSGGNHSDMDLIIVHNMQPRCGDPAKGGTGHLTWSDGKTYCLTSVQKDSLVRKKHQQDELNYIEGKSRCLVVGSHGNSKHFTKTVINSRIRRLTPIECERLQCVPDKQIICIFAICLDQAKNYVNAVEQNPKLLKLVLSAEKEKLNELVKHAGTLTKQNNLQTKYIAHQNVDMLTQKQINQCKKTTQKESNIIVKNVENIAMFKNQNQEEDFAHPSAFINITEGRITHYGTEEQHQKGNHSTLYLNGNKPLFLFGNEIMQLVKDVELEMKNKEDMSFTSTILSVLSTSSLEMMLITCYWFVKNAITGSTQEKTSQKNLLLQFKITDGHTSSVSDSQRYKMLGNGWNIQVINHIFSYL